jgi:maltose O-acetyltransferase
MGNQADGKSWLDCVRAGEPFAMIDFEFLGSVFAGKEKAERYNNLPVGTSLEEVTARLRDLFGTVGDGAIVVPRVSVDVGFNVEIGDRSFVNQNATFLDTYPIRIGNDVQVGPNCAFYPVGHPVRAADRNFRDPSTGERRSWTSGASIVVEDDVWIGGNSVILQGVTIGTRSMIGAGSVVTRSVPPDVFAAGNPCRVIRRLD